MLWLYHMLAVVMRKQYGNSCMYNVWNTSHLGDNHSPPAELCSRNITISNEASFESTMMSNAHTNLEEKLGHIEVSKVAGQV